MTVATFRLSEALQTLIDARLDTIDRMLLGRAPRADRLAIVRDLESQIFDLLQERDVEGLGREDVLDVLARLDPPEAYLPDEDGELPAVPRDSYEPRGRTTARKGRDDRASKASGILGLCAVAFVLMIPLVFVMAGLLESEAILIIGCPFLGFLAFVSGILAVALGLYSRRNGLWPIVGMVTGGLSLMLSFFGGVVGLLLMFEG